MTEPLESLPAYVTRMMEEKGINAKEVQVRSGNAIADAYVSKIAKGKVKYPSAFKLQGLAAGLGVDEDELFRVARGIPLKGKQQKGGEPWPGPVLAKAMSRIVTSHELTKAVQILLTSPPEKLKRIVKILEDEAGRRPSRRARR